MNIGNIGFDWWPGDFYHTGQQNFGVMNTPGTSVGLTLIDKWIIIILINQICIFEMEYIIVTLLHEVSNIITIQNLLALHFILILGDFIALILKETIFMISIQHK